MAEISLEDFHRLGYADLCEQAETKEHCPQGQRNVTLPRVVTQENSDPGEDERRSVESRDEEQAQEREETYRGMMTPEEEREDIDREVERLKDAYLESKRAKIAAWTAYNEACRRRARRPT